ncbi:MAG: Thiosulfate sulfurtransferase GlpE, partial [Alphaproteobacteria bacterium MarineAlpha10_Bin3]
MAGVARKFRVRHIDTDTLAAWQGEAASRTLYLFDVRSPDEFMAGHVAGSRSAPGGQLVQVTDRFAITANARIVLIDDTGVRATMTASWLIQMGWSDVYVLDGGLENMARESGPRTVAAPEVDAVSVTGLAPSAFDLDDVLVIDLADSLSYRDGHIAGAWWAIRARLADALTRLPAAKSYLVTSPDGRLARLGAADLALLTTAPIRVLEGGTTAWRAAGLPMEKGYQPVDEVCPGRRSHRLILWGPVLKGICRWQWD